MEKFFTLFRLGLKYLYRYRRRYGFLLAALVFGFAVVTLITSLKDGMYDNVYYTAQSHYTGDLIAVGYDTDSSQSSRLGQKETSAILSAAGTAEINPEHTVLRTIATDCIVHFNGAAVELKYVIGCDWEEESFLFGNMLFEDRVESFSGDDGIVLSAPTAQQLGARTGDRIILESKTRWGQKNTGPFIVKGIVRDASIFGYYKAYISRLSLNRLLVYEDGDCSTIGFFLENRGAAEQKRKDLQNALAGQVQLGPLVYNRDELSYQRHLPREGIKVFLYTLPVYLSDISNLLNAMNIITYFLYGMMLLIILVSAAVNYRLILHERTKELGVMRVIGFYGADLRFVLWVEIMGVALIALAAGFALALVFSWLVSLLPFTWFPSFEIFMKNGRLTALYLPGTMLINVVSIFLVLFAMAVFPAFRASRKNLPGLLSGEPL